jgi:nucleoside phosphorylase
MAQKNYLFDIDTILVPQGAEYQAVCRGLGLRTTSQIPQVVPIPVGMEALSSWLQNQNFLNKPPQGVLLMGLGGSLSPDLSVGEAVLYQGCGSIGNNQHFQWQNCHQFLNYSLFQYLPEKVHLVKGLTSDRVLNLASEKRQLGQIYQVEVVDMEGFAVLEYFNRANIPVSIIRVIGDDCQQDLPDLTAAFSAAGQLQPLILVLKMLEQPVAAFQLIRSSLRGLKRLEKVASELFSVRGSCLFHAENAEKAERRGKL